MRLISCLCFVACFIEIAIARGDATPVGDFGNPERVVIEGAKTFSPNKIRRELSVSAEFLLAADPDGPLYGCVAATERLVRTGYRNSGFPDVQVKASADMKARAIVVRVKEGPRYLAGEIRVRGNKAIPLAQLIARLTQPYPPGNALPRSPREGRGQSGTCWVDRNGNNVELSDPVWSPGKPAAFPASANDWKLHGDAFNALGDLGFFRARFSVDVVVNPATKKADLVIDISKEGPRSEFASVMITGNEANSRQEILKCIGFRTGLPATRDQLAAIQERLWRSGRFIKSQVTLIRPATPADGAVLSINVSELHGAPPLGKPLTPEEAILLKCRDWLVNSDRWGGDLVCQCDAAEGSLRAVFSPGNGMFATIKCNSAPQQKPAEFAIVASPAEVGFYDLLGKRRLAGRPANGQLVGCVAIRLDDDANEEKVGGRGKLSFGFGIKSERSQWTLPLDLILSLDPVCFLDMVHWRETKCTVEHDVLTLANARGLLRLDAPSGRPLDAVLENPVEEKSEETTSNKNKQTVKSSPHESHTVLRFSVVSGEFRRRLDAVHVATARTPNAYVLQRPLSSLLGFALDYDPVWQWLTQTDDKRFRRVVRRMLDKHVCEPFDRVAVTYFGGEGDNSSGESDSFCIPRAAAPPAAVEEANSETARITTFLCAAARLAFVPGSWPDAVGRDAVVMFRGYGDAAVADTKRAYRSDKSGPICLLAASMATAKCNPNIGDLMATRGLERLSLSDFRNDYAALLDPNCPSGQFFQRVAEFLRDADDSDIQSLGAILPGNAAVPFRNWVGGLRQNRDQPAVASVPVLFDAVCEGGGRGYGKVILDAIQRSCATAVPYGSPDNMVANASQALRIDPKFTRAYSIRGCAYCKKGDYDSAIADYTEAIRLDADDLVGCHRARAWLYIQKADFDSLIADCSEVTRLAPKDAEAYCYRAWAYQMKAAKRVDAAAAPAEMASGHPFSGSLGFPNRDQDKAGSSSGATAPLSKRSTPWAADNKDACLDNAISDYTRAIRLNPKLIQAYYNRGLAYEARAETSKAAADFAQAKKLGYTR